MSQQGHFGYKLPKGIIGEVSSTATSTIRTFISNEAFHFGELLEIDNTTPPESEAVKLLGEGIPNNTKPVLGLSVYLPDKPSGQYEIGENVSVLFEGDIRVKIKAGDTFHAGDHVHIIEKIGFVEPGTSRYELTTNPLATGDVYGVMLEGGSSLVGTGRDNSFRMNYRFIGLITSI